MTEARPRDAHDVVDLLTHQHQQIKSLFERTMSSAGADREQAFFDLRRTLAVHETAEEEVVHPRARRELTGGEAIVAERLREENDAKKLLAELEALDVDSPEFTEKLTTLRDAVIAHAEHEEREEFGRLEAELADDQLEMMGRAARLVEAFAPTRPHPGIESATANVLIGPFASMLDRVRDWLTRVEVHDGPDGRHA